MGRRMRTAILFWTAGLLIGCGNALCQSSAPELPDAPRPALTGSLSASRNFYPSLGVMVSRRSELNAGEAKAFRAWHPDRSSFRAQVFPEAPEPESQARRLFVHAQVRPGPATWNQPRLSPNVLGLAGRSYAAAVLPRLSRRIPEDSPIKWFLSGHWAGQRY